MRRVLCDIMRSRAHPRPAAHRRAAASSTLCSGPDAGYAAWVVALLVAGRPGEMAQVGLPLIRRLGEVLVQRPAAMQRMVLRGELWQLYMADAVLAMHGGSGGGSWGGEAHGLNAAYPGLWEEGMDAYRKRLVSMTNTYRAQVEAAAHRLTGGQDPLFDPGSVQTRAEVSGFPLYADVLATLAGQSRVQGEGAAAVAGHDQGGDAEGVLEQQQPRHVLLMVDGPSWYITNDPDRPTGRTVLHHALMRHVFEQFLQQQEGGGARHVLVHIPAYEWLRLRGVPDQLDAYLQRKVNDALTPQHQN